MRVMVSRSLTSENSLTMVAQTPCPTAFPFCSSLIQAAMPALSRKTYTTLSKNARSLCLPLAIQRKAGLLFLFESASTERGCSRARPPTKGPLPRRCNVGFKVGRIGERPTAVPGPDVPAWARRWRRARCSGSQQTPIATSASRLALSAWPRIERCASGASPRVICQLICQEVCVLQRVRAGAARPRSLRPKFRPVFRLTRCSRS